MVQNQSGDFREQIAEYIESFVEVNNRDAPKSWTRKKEEGVVNRTRAVKIDGKFDNATAYVTRDYLYFAPAKAVSIIVCVPSKNADQLGIADYIASAYKTK